MVTTEQFESIPDEALPVIQTNSVYNNTYENVSSPALDAQDDVSATLEAVKRHALEGETLAKKKEAIIKTVLERKAAAIREFDHQLNVLGYQDPSMPDWVKSTKFAVQERKEVAPAPVEQSAVIKPIGGKPCPVCLVPGHDLRAKAHRDQKKKAPLTPAQLTAMAKYLVPAK